MTVTLIDEFECDVKGYLKLNSFAGGDKGRCVQLTTPYEGYVQMTFDQAREFFKLAIEEINEIESRFNEYPPWWEVIRDSSTSTKTGGENG